MIYGYLRVSTDEQDSDSQKQGVDSFAAARGWKVDQYIRDDGVSGGKDPCRRNLGPLLDMLKKGDRLIAAEISRLGRDLLMVMDILNHCMKVGCIVYTVKDNYVLGDDVQSKVLAFAFGLSAEIERKMIQARTREGLALRVKKGILLGRPLGRGTSVAMQKGVDMRDDILMQYRLGVPLRRMAVNLGIDRQTIVHRLIDWGEITDKKLVAAYEKCKRESQERIKAGYKERGLCIVQFTDDEREKLIRMIEADMTLPEIQGKMSSYTYEQIYDTVYATAEFNRLYRQHAQKILTGERRRTKGNDELY